MTRQDCLQVISLRSVRMMVCLFFFQAEDGIRDLTVTGVQTCALPIFYDTYRTQGAFAAMGTFGRAVEEGGPKYSEQQQQGQPSPEQAAMMQRMMGNFDFFLAHEIRAIGGYVPDIAALKATRDRIVIGGGKSSGEQGAYRAARALADAIGIELTYFEGGHGGFGASEDAFAKTLHESLSAERAGSPI